MKPLSIEEIKKLNCGEWLWIVDDRHKLGDYWCKTCSNDGKPHWWSADDNQFHKEYPYSDYGKTWVAYKNKEQAECDNSYDLLKVKYEIVLKEYAKLKRKATKYNFMTKTIDKEITKQAEQKLIELRGKE